jgi:putative ABC transport system permease protein
VLWHVQRPALAAAALGAVLGVGVSLAASRLIEGLLFDTRPDDPIALAAVGLVLAAAVLAAGHLAARAALRVDVVEALRTE